MVEKPLAKLVRNETNPKTKSYLARIAQFVSTGDGGENGFVAPAEKLREFILEIEDQFFSRQYNIPACLKTANKELAKTFNYDKFSRYPANPGQWHAGLLMEEALKHLRYCPYCNADMVYAIVTEKTRAKSDFDHFFPRGRYPFLSLSLYNLLPACNRCNSRFKRSKYKATLSTFHPYLDDLDEETWFVLMGLTKAMRYGEPSNGNLSVHLQLKPDQPDSEQVRLDNYQDLFRINEVYSRLYDDQALQILHLGSVINKTYLAEIQHRLTAAGLQLDATNLLMDMPLKRTKIDWYRIGKLKLDVLEHYCGIHVAP